MFARDIKSTKYITEISAFRRGVGGIGYFEITFRGGSVSAVEGSKEEYTGMRSAFEKRVAEAPPKLRDTR